MQTMHIPQSANIRTVLRTNLKRELHKKKQKKEKGKAGMISVKSLR